MDSNVCPANTRGRHTPRQGNRQPHVQPSGKILLTLKLRILYFFHIAFVETFISLYKHRNVYLLTGDKFSFEKCDFDRLIQKLLHFSFFKKKL